MLPSDGYLAPDDVIAQALQELEIDVDHSAQSHQETHYWLTHHGLDEPTLTDLTHLPFVTIDNPDSRDLDQALYIERQEYGFRVLYALADAAWYIRPGSALFADALAKGTTFYTPTMAAPMLPTALSEGLISLNPQVDRRALVFDMRVSEHGAMMGTRILRSKIHSRAKLNYAGVQAWLDSNQPPSAEYEPSLLLLRELGKLLIKAGEQRGVVRFDRTETRIQVAGDPPRFQASLRDRYDTERYNEQISLMCNMQGAELLLGLERSTESLQAVFRVHDAPLKKSLNELRETLQAFASKQEHPEHWQWLPGQGLADYLDSLPDAPEYKRRVRAVQRQIMQAQRASSFQPEAGEHHALKAASYARFSSPMREVVGIFTHKELLEALNGERGESEADERLRVQVIEAANSAKQKQRQLDKKIAFAALSSEFNRELDTGEHITHTGTIMGLRRDRLYITLDDKALDIKLYLDTLERTYATTYTLGPVTAVPHDPQKPHWQLGDAVTLQLTGYDRERSRFLFTMAKA